MTTRPRTLAATLALTLGLAACGGSTDPVASPDEDQSSMDQHMDDDMPDESPSSDGDTDSSDDTSMPADEDVQPSGEITEDEARAVGQAYLGLSVSQAQEQAEVDGREFRIGAEDGEQYMLTEDYVLGRVTVTVTDGVITEVVVEASEQQVTVAE